MRMKCPKCQEDTLDEVEVGGVEVDRCAQCYGIWFDEDELTELLDQDPKNLEQLMGGDDDEHLTEKPGICPRDGDEMLRVCSARDREVVVDLCMMCRGIWLDGGEFKRLKKS